MSYVLGNELRYLWGNYSVSLLPTCCPLFLSLSLFYLRFLAPFGGGNKLGV